MSAETAGHEQEARPRVKPLLTLAVVAAVYFAIASFAFWNHTVPTLPLVATAVLGALMMALSLADGLDLDLPKSLPLVLAACGLIATLVMVPEALPSRLAGAVSGLAVMQLLVWVWRRTAGFVGPQRSDVLLFGAGGAWIGVEGLATALLWAATGLVLSGVLALATGYRVERTAQIPFGPCLGLGVWLVWLFKPLVE